MGSLQRDPLGTFSYLARRYGRVARIRFGFWDVLVVSQPDDVKHVLQDRHAIYTKESLDYRVMKRILGEGLVTSDGALWLRQRRLMQPAFQRESVAAFAALMVERARALLDGWEGAARDGTAIDVYQEMRRLSLDIVTRALFGVKVQDDARTVGESFAILSEALASSLYSPLFLLFLLPGVPTPTNRRARAALRTLDGIVGGIIARRRAKTAAAEGDLLALLLEARDEETNEEMDDRQLRDEVMTVLLAGHETTAMALSWTCYLLDCHREIAEGLRTEIAGVLGDRDPTVDDLPQLGGLTRAIEEAIRLYPPAWIITRIAKEEDEIGGYRVRPRTLVTLSPFVTHRSPEVWPDPERYEPDRFTPERSEGRPRFAYFPFAGGPRQCIGIEFALTEATLALAMVLRRYRLELVPGHRVEPQPLITHRPRGGLPMVPYRV
jgi:cytochrome P450